VIVNDASPEDIDSIVHAYDSPRIRYYKNEVNRGALHVTDNWNKCLSLALGSFFVLMGDDDIMDRRYLEGFEALIERYPACGVYHCRTKIIDENSQAVRLSEPRPEFESVYDSVLERMTGGRIFFVSDYLYRTETLRKVGGYYKLPLAWASDDITSYLAAMDHGIAHTNEPLFMYRQSALTLSSTGNIMHKMDAIMQEGVWLEAFAARAPSNEVDQLLLVSIRREIRKFIQKKKIRTICSSGDGVIGILFKWFGRRKKYTLSVSEIFYAAAMRVVEKRKSVYVFIIVLLSQGFMIPGNGEMI